MAAKDFSDGDDQKPVPASLSFDAPQEVIDTQAFPIAGPQRDYKPGDRIGGRYTVMKKIGQGTGSVAYKAQRPGGGLVAIKALTLRSMQDWRQLELFEREARALQGLRHEGIPRFVEYFEVDTASDRGFFLVQELVEGKTLGDLVASGWTPSETDVQRIADQLLRTTQYLQSKRIVHGDIKPENVVLEGGKPGGRCLLVDFGAMRQLQAEEAAATQLIDAGTFTGTWGFAAPEQMRGQTQPGSDLYGLGATLVYLISGKPPSAFPQRRLRLDLSSLKASPQMQALLAGLLEPAWEDRLTAAEARAMLAGKAVERPLSVDQAVYKVEQGVRQLFSWKRLQGLGSRARSAWEQATTAPSQNNTPAGTAQSPEVIGFQESTSSPEPELVGQSPNPGAIILTLAAASVFAGPLFPFVALTLPIWAQALSGGRRRPSSRVRSGPPRQQQQQQRGFGFSLPDDEPQYEHRSAFTPAQKQQMRMLSQRRRQMAMLQQQRMMQQIMWQMSRRGGGLMGPFGMQGPFMF
eukprot:jgi/Astpho2/2711/Aster-00897